MGQLVFRHLCLLIFFLLSFEFLLELHELTLHLGLVRCRGLHVDVCCGAVLDPVALVREATYALQPLGPEPIVLEWAQDDHAEPQRVLRGAVVQPTDALSLLSHDAGKPAVGILRVQVGELVLRRLADILHARDRLHPPVGHADGEDEDATLLPLLVNHTLDRLYVAKRQPFIDDGILLGTELSTVLVDLEV